MNTDNVQDTKRIAIKAKKRFISMVRFDTYKKARGRKRLRFARNKPGKSPLNSPKIDFSNARKYDH
jgi:hypothetical protein